MFKTQHHKKGSERKNKPRRVDSSRAEQVKTLTQFQINQKKTQPHKTTQKGPPHKTEIKLGIDFWRAVEFSRIGRTPTRKPHDHAPGQPIKLTCRAPIRIIGADPWIGALCWALAVIHKGPATVNGACALVAVVSVPP